jgi:hypothetical protein
MGEKDEHFKTSLAVHSDNRRSKHCQQRRIANSSCFEKSVYHAGMKIFKSLANNLKGLMNKKQAILKDPQTIHV